MGVGVTLIPALELRSLLIRQQVLNPHGHLNCSDISDVHTILYFQPQLLLEDGQVEGVGVSWGVKLTAQPLEQKAGLVTQQ